MRNAASAVEFFHISLRFDSRHNFFVVHFSLRNENIPLLSYGFFQKIIILALIGKSPTLIPGIKDQIGLGKSRTLNKCKSPSRENQVFSSYFCDRHNVIGVVLV
jgi:hypothetical protein